MWHCGVCCCPAAVGGEGVGSVGSGVGDESVAAAVLAVGLEGGGWQLAREASAILFIVQKIVLCGALFLLLGVLFCSQERSLLSAPYCSPPVSKIFQV